jgi:predicted NAD/FAD-dependent oxidoreductase
MPGMNKIAKHLAEGLNLHINTRVISIKRIDTWQLTDKSGQLYNKFDWVISTAPATQALELLPKTFKYYDHIKNIKMRACFSLMLDFSKKLPLEFEAAHVIHSDISWIAVNSHKPRRADRFTLIVHSLEEYSEAHINDDRKTVMQHLMNETSNVVGHDVIIADYQKIQGWRYANNAKREYCQMFLDPDLKLAARGDLCLGGRIEGAFTSAYNFVNTMKECVL